MNVIRDGQVIGEIVLTGATSQCAYEGEHGSLPYGFMRQGASVPEIVVCDTHCHTDAGYFAWLLSKIPAEPIPGAASPTHLTIDNGLLPCPFCGGLAFIELAWRKSGRWVAYCEANCVGDIHTHYFGSEEEARGAWNTRAQPEELRRSPKDIIGNIVADICSRKGLRHEWDAIDDEIRDEIVAEWETFFAPSPLRARSDAQEK